MAARRLLTVLIVLLVLSSLAAALVPIERSNEESSTTTTTTTTTTTAAETRTIDETVNDSRKRRTLKIAVGDRLGLTVRSRQPAQVNIPDFGELEDTDAALPAHFDLLAYRAGRFPVRLLQEGRQGRTIATIDVAKRPSAKAGAKGTGKAKGRDEKARKRREKGSRPARPAS